MESFGLFSLLQSLLGAQSQENPPSADTADTPPPTVEQSRTAPQTTEQKETIPTSSDAFLGFMATHEERMKRIREQKK